MAKKQLTFWGRVGRRAWRNWKVTRAFVAPADPKKKRVLFIFGHQRSGTTMLIVNVLEWDPRARVYGEQSALTLPPPHRLRLRPLPEVAEIISRYPEALVVAKPLVESGRAAEILGAVPNSRGIWFFRDFIDNIDSQIHRFHRQVDDLRLMLHPDEGDWRHVGVSEEQKELIRRYFKPDMSREDAAALLWYVRSSFYYLHGLDRMPEMALLRYEDITSRPAEVVRNLYRFLDLDYPGDALIRQIHTRSVGKKVTLALSPEIRALCVELQNRLEESNADHGLGGRNPAAGTAIAPSAAHSGTLSSHQR
ncbi:MAG: hypothetical protein EHM42_04405 [Planctomycetaceae bacterium]|nr:MAG: hypothetical protein EHM42_04405 [Planctomycetaceae bacterium]